MEKRQPLTNKQQVVLDFIKSHIENTGSSPSVREICTAADIRSTSTVHLHLKNLEKKGYIHRQNFKNRSIELVAPSDTDIGVTAVPIMGQSITDFFSPENIEDYFYIPNTNIKDKSEYFMSRILNESMSECGILSRDMVLVEKQSNAADGDIIIVIVNDHISCKRFFTETGNKIILYSENPHYKPITASMEDITILGRVTGLFRSLL